MRDGIYKDLPMPRGWQSLLRACLREAERGDIARRAADKALHADVKRDVSSEFMRRLRQMAESNQPNLPGFASPGLHFAVGLAASPLERCIAQQAMNLHALGAGGLDLMQRALSRGLADMQSQQLRQVEQHIYLYGGRDARDVMTAVRAACKGLAEQLAAECCGAAPKRSATAIRTRIDLDEDLAIHP